MGQFVFLRHGSDFAQDGNVTGTVADERWVIAGNDGISVADDDGAVIFRAVAGQQRRNGEIESVYVFQWGMIVGDNNAAGILPGRGSQINLTSVRAMQADGIPFFRPDGGIQKGRRSEGIQEQIRRGLFGMVL